MSEKQVKAKDNQPDMTSALGRQRGQWASEPSGPSLLSKFQASHGYTADFVSRAKDTKQVANQKELL